MLRTNQNWVLDTIVSAWTMWPLYVYLLVGSGIEKNILKRNTKVYIWETFLTYNS